MRHRLATKPLRNRIDFVVEGSRLWPNQSQLEKKQKTEILRSALFFLRENPPSDRGSDDDGDADNLRTRHSCPEPTHSAIQISAEKLDHEAEKGVRDRKYEQNFAMKTFVPAEQKQDSKDEEARKRRHDLRGPDSQ